MALPILKTIINSSSFCHRTKYLIESTRRYTRALVPRLVHVIPSLVRCDIRGSESLIVSPFPALRPRITTFHRRTFSFTPSTNCPTYRQRQKKAKNSRHRFRHLDVDAEARFIERQGRMMKMPGFDKIIEARGGCPEDGVSPEMLESFLDVHLKDTNDTSMTAIMSFCGEAGSSFLPAARRLLNHVEQNKLSNHFTFDLSYLCVLGNSIEDVPEIDEEFTHRFDEFMATHNFALTSAEVCKELLRNVAKSSVWMKGFQLLGRLKAANDVGWHNYYPLVEAATRDANLDVILLLQKNFLQSMDTLPTIDVLRCHKTPNMSAIWNSVLVNLNELRERDASTAKANVEKLLSHWRAIGHIPHIDVAAQLADFFLNYYGDPEVVHQHVQMPKNGICPITGNLLQRLELVKFEDIQNQFLDAILVRENVYVNSDPVDLSRLLKFIKDHGPFDIVIDGLNVSFHDNKLDESPIVMIRQVLQVAKYLKTSQGKKVAVISRDWWERPLFKHVMSDLRKVAHVLTTNQMTNDDLFTLHCCLESGPDCYLITNDLLRDHRSKWRPELRPAFALWQHARQINVNYDNVTHKLALITPRQYLTAVQEVNGTLYIPHHAVDEETQEFSHTRQDIKDGVTVENSFHVPNTFLVINPNSRGKRPNSFFETHPLPDWGTV